MRLSHDKQSLVSLIPWPPECHESISLPFMCRETIPWPTIYHDSIPRPLLCHDTIPWPEVCRDVYPRIGNGKWVQSLNHTYVMSLSHDQKCIVRPPHGQECVVSITPKPWMCFESTNDKRRNCESKPIILSVLWVRLPTKCVFWSNHKTKSVLWDFHMIDIVSCVYPITKSLS